MRNLEETNGKHRGQSCFILGAGPSVHFLDRSLLKGHVVIAVNSGYCAYPQADYFVSDDHETAKWNFFSNDLKKSETTVLLYEDKLKDVAYLFGERAILFRHRKGYHITDHYLHDDPKLHICQARTSLGSAIHIAHIMGFEKVGLLGVDCCRLEGHRYFWQFWKDQPKRTDGHGPDKFVKIQHQGRQSDTDLVNIISYWHTRGEEMNKKIKIFNLSEISTIKIFPKITLKEFL